MNSMMDTTRPSPRPFLKWAGGKGALVDEILKRMPVEIPFYVEAFVGGGAVFFALAREGRIRRALLADRNHELVNTWISVRDEVEAVIDATRQWTVDKSTYYAVRGLDTKTLSPATRAARVIWLNRTCYNGLYRLNASGRFNVPFGRYASPPRIDEGNLRRCSAALQDVEILQGDFEETLERASEGAVIYLDPPYAPVSATASFNRYDGMAFDHTDQARLADQFANLPHRGIRHALLSNSDTPQTRRLYTRPGQRVHEVMVRRSINRDAAGRAHVMELLVELALDAGEPQ